MKSSPALASVPTPTEQPAPGRDGFIWPSPPYASYRDDEGPLQASPCEVEGTNGQSRRCLLMSLDTTANARRHHGAGGAAMTALWTGDA